MIQSIDEANRAIAELLGWKSNCYPNLPDKLHRFFGTEEEKGLHISNMTYHCSWDSLIPAVKEARQWIKKSGLGFDIILEWETVFIEALKTLELKTVYGIMIEFIRFYKKEIENTEEPF